jgi:hypothetical protein
VQRCASRNAHEHTGSAEAIRPSLRNGFTAYFVLSLATGLFCHHRQRDAKNTPGIIANLTPATGRQDHTTSPYESLAVRPRAKNARRRGLRPPHPVPTFVTMANAPLPGTGRLIEATDLPPMKTEIFLQRGLDTQISVERATKIGG